MARLEQEWSEELALRRRQNRLRTLPEARGEDFCSNDYLGLARHPAIREAIERALRDGVALGSGGSRLVRGNHPAIAKLERRFAVSGLAARGTEAALLYSSGYAAGVGVLTALLRPQDIVFSDVRNHASLIDGMRLAGARRVVVAHNDPEALREALLRHPAMGNQRRWLVIESLYSMDGDQAPVAALGEVCREFGVAMIVDEAHATGLYPPAELPGVITASLHPCGKALGASGALVAGSRRLIEYLVNSSRSFIYSTAPSPLLAVQIATALEVIEAEPERRTEVFRLARQLRHGLGLEMDAAGGESPIVPWILGRDEDALAAAAELAARGLDVRAIRPPTVPEGSARLRLTVHAGQSPSAIERLCAELSSLAPIPA